MSETPDIIVRVLFDGKTHRLFNVMTEEILPDDQATFFYESDAIEFARGNGWLLEDEIS